MDHECQICSKRSQQCFPCPECGALYYCSERHRQRHLRLGHGDECARMAKQMLHTDVRAPAPVQPGCTGSALIQPRSVHAQALRAFPFPWAQQLTSLQHSPKMQLCHLLESHGCHGVGLWQRECACGSAGPSQPWGAHGPAFPPGQSIPHALPDLASLTGLSPDMVPCLRSKVGGAHV